MGKRKAALHSYLSSSFVTLQDKCFLFFSLFFKFFFFSIFLPAPGLEQAEIQDLVQFSLFDREDARGERGGKKVRKMRRIILTFFSSFDFSLVFLKETFAVETQGEGNLPQKDPATIWLNYIGWIRERLAGINDTFDLFSVVAKNTVKADDPWVWSKNQNPSLYYEPLFYSGHFYQVDEDTKMNFNLVISV